MGPTRGGGEIEGHFDSETSVTITRCLFLWTSTNKSTTNRTLSLPPTVSVSKVCGLHEWLLYKMRANIQVI